MPDALDVKPRYKPGELAAIAEAARIPAGRLESAYSDFLQGNYAGEWFPFSRGRRAHAGKWLGPAIDRAWSATRPDRVQHFDPEGVLTDLREYCACYLERTERADPFPEPYKFVAPSFWKPPPGPPSRRFNFSGPVSSPTATTEATIDQAGTESAAEADVAPEVAGVPAPDHTDASDAPEPTAAPLPARTIEARTDLPPIRPTKPEKPAKKKQEEAVSLF